eukprot:CAMPEP_0197933174 /NCGR_PEP_ID=MMETSP1439-20131203/109740_1 /TAXON_ID=66791 /ORGANISM="Gonyaulax spinifera, Strain CCMP409" /LENGTH=163 /DNA_ID=CAMNT_0043555989 /DNA_START=104 /DNA_END=592 /DNA_ORIENTATION=+
MDVRVEVADKDDGITKLGVLRDDVQEIQGRGWPTADAASVCRQGAVVVHEEHRLASLPVQEASPQGDAFAKVHGALLIDPHETLAPAQELPARIPEGNDSTNRATDLPPDEHVLLEQQRRVEARSRQAEPWVVKLLEPNEVKGHWPRCGHDDLGRAVAVAPQL